MTSASAPVVGMEADRTSSKVLHPPGGVSSVGFGDMPQSTAAEVAGHGQQQQAAGLERESMFLPTEIHRKAAEMRNKSSIFDDGERVKCQRKMRPGDESSSNIFGGDMMAAPAAPGVVHLRSHEQSSVFAEPEQVTRPVRNRMKSDVFSAPDTGDDKPRNVKDYQKSSVFGNVQENSGSHANQNGEQLIADDLHGKQNGSPGRDEDEEKENGHMDMAELPGRPAAGAISKASAFNPITGEDVVAFDARASTAPPTAHGYLGDSNAATTSVTSFGRRNFREGSFNPITGANYSPPKQVVGPAQPPAIKRNPHHRITQPPGGASSSSLW